MKPVFSLQSTPKLTVEFNLYAEVGRLVRSKKIPKANKRKSLRWWVLNWKHLPKCYSIALMHRKIVQAAVHRKRAAPHRQPGGYQLQSSTNLLHKVLFFFFFWMLCEKFYAIRTWARKKFKLKSYVNSCVAVFIKRFCGHWKLVDCCWT